MINDDLTTIGPIKVCCAILYRISDFTICMLCIAAYFSIPAGIQPYYYSNSTLFIILFMLFLIKAFSKLADLHCLISHYGQTMHIKYLEALLPNNQGPISILIKLLVFVIMVIELYFISQFTLLTLTLETADDIISAIIHADLAFAHFVMKVITVYGYAHWVCFIFSLLTLIPCPRFQQHPIQQNQNNEHKYEDEDEHKHEDEQKHEQGNKQKQMKKIIWRNTKCLSKYLTFIDISYYYPKPLNCPSDKICTLCYKNIIDYTWIELPCKDRFHSECIDSLLLKHISCPTCKITILNPILNQVPNQVPNQISNQVSNQVPNQIQIQIQNIVPYTFSEFDVDPETSSEEAIV